MEPSPERAQLRLRQVACLGFLAFSSLLCSAAAPVNDTCTGAVLIPEAGPFPFVAEVIDVTEATSVGDPPLPPPFTASDGSHSIWYRFIPSSSGLYTLSVGADTVTKVSDTLMGIYRASGCGNVNGSALFAFNDDSGELQSAISTNLVSGQEYFVVVWVGPVESATNDLKVQLRVSQPTVPANDSCAGAEVIPSIIPTTGYLTGVADNTLASTTPGLTPNCASSDPDSVPSREVWYRFAPAAAGTYIFSTRSPETLTSVNDTLIAIYTNEAPCASSWFPLGGGCNDNGFSRAAFTVNLRGDTTYFILVYDNSAEPIAGETLVQLRVTPAAAPTVTTLPVVSIASTGAVLSGTINANGLRSSYWFEWGPTSGLGSTSRVRFIFGDNPLVITTNLAIQPPSPQTLQANTPYFYRFVAVNDNGMARGEEQQFLWSDTPPHLETPVRAGNDVRLQFTGNHAQLYLIQSTTGFNSVPWTALGLATNTSANAFQYLHRAGGTDNNRLYRIQLP